MLSMRSTKQMEIFPCLLFVNNDLYVCFIRAPRSIIIIIGPVYLPATRRQIKVAPFLFTSYRFHASQKDTERIELNEHVFGNGK